jgi:hypothetical protein
LRRWVWVADEIPEAEGEEENDDMDELDVEDESYVG